MARSGNSHHAKQYWLAVAAGVAISGGLLVLIRLLNGSFVANGCTAFSPFGWAAVLLAAIVVGLVGWSLAGIAKPPRFPDGPDDTHTLCPSCGETVMTEWRLCPYCGGERGPSDGSRGPADEVRGPSDGARGPAHEEQDEG